jgi:uncharacterized caspase-like protein
VGAKDYAVVVGVKRYPSFGPTPAEAHDLRGPDNDARDVYAWLIDPFGGAVPPENVKCVSSAQYPDPFNPPGAVAPKPSDITAAFRWLENIAQRNNRNANGLGLHIGDRFYFYASGHGYASRRNDASVFTANATATRLQHIEVSEWARWFYEAEYFNEYVLVVDCCMVRDVDITAGRVGFRTVNPSKSPPLFSVYAARFPGQAVETEMEDGEYHGAFTWALLKGLRSAVDTTGAVTTQSLKGYLMNALPRFMSPEQRAAAEVANEPDFGSEDGIILARPPELTFDITLLVPQLAVGHPYTIVTGSPPQEVKNGVVPSVEFTVKLPNGLYVMHVAVTETTGGFEVIGVSRDVSLV